jgi:hypothetical protein
VSGTITDLGSVTVGEAIPAPSAAQAALLLRLQASLDAALQAGVSLSVNLADPAAFLAQLTLGLSQLSANLALFASPPSISAQASANATLTAALNPAVSLQVSLAAALATAGLHLFVYDGTIPGAGGTIQGGFDAAGLTGSAKAVILVADAANTALTAALEAAFRTS